MHVASESGVPITRVSPGLHSPSRQRAGFSTLVTSKNDAGPDVRAANMPLLEVAIWRPAAAASLSRLLGTGLMSSVTALVASSLVVTDAMSTYSWHSALAKPSLAHTCD